MGCENKLLRPATPMNDVDPAVAGTRPPKCVVWDLDGTLWPGALAEDEDVQPLPDRLEMIRRLDGAGILQSVASRNDPATVVSALKRHGLADYFLHPQIHPGDKSKSLVRIARALNIGLESLVLVDDDPFERAQVASALGDVRSMAPEELQAVAAEWLDERVKTTPEAIRRRQNYQVEAARAESSRQFATRREFLASLGLEMSIRAATFSDFDRAEELVRRANRMNSAGRGYQEGALRQLISLPGHRMVVASLRDRFGDYGTIGIAVLCRKASLVRLRLFLVSCRVMNRGAGEIFLNWIVSQAVGRSERLEVEFEPSAQNRPLYIAFRFSGFMEDSDEGGGVLLHDGRTVRHCPAHVRLVVGEGVW